MKKGYLIVLLLLISIVCFGQGQTNKEHFKERHKDFFTEHKVEGYSLWNNYTDSVYSFFQQVDLNSILGSDHLVVFEKPLDFEYVCKYADNLIQQVQFNNDFNREIMPESDFANIMYGMCDTVELDKPIGLWNLPKMNENFIGFSDYNYLYDLVGNNSSGCLKLVQLSIPIFDLSEHYAIIAVLVDTLKEPVFLFFKNDYMNSNNSDTKKWEYIGQDRVCDFGRSVFEYLGDDIDKRPFAFRFLKRSKTLINCEIVPETKPNYNFEVYADSAYNFLQEIDWHELFPQKNMAIYAVPLYLDYSGYPSDDERIEEIECYIKNGNVLSEFKIIRADSLKYEIPIENWQLSRMGGKLIKISDKDRFEKFVQENTLPTFQSVHIITPFFNDSFTKAALGLVTDNPEPKYYLYERKDGLWRLINK